VIVEGESKINESTLPFYEQEPNQQEAADITKRKTRPEQLLLHKSIQLELAS
jgi:hypothetical protein